MSPESIGRAKAGANKMRNEHNKEQNKEQKREEALEAVGLTLHPNHTDAAQINIDLSV
ncbi:hypothetical protein ACVBEF_09820 [Glaciimonas sp. GG7]